MSKKQLLLTIFAPIVIVITWFGLYIFLEISAPHYGTCNAMCAYPYDKFWGNCCENGVLQQTVGVYLYPYAGFIEAGAVVIEFLLAMLLFRKWKKKLQRR